MDIVGESYPVTALRDRQFDAWLFYDHHHRDPIAYSVLGLPETRWSRAAGFICAGEW